MVGDHWAARGGALPTGPGPADPAGGVAARCPACTHALGRMAPVAHAGVCRRTPSQAPQATSRAVQNLMNSGPDEAVTLLRAGLALVPRNLPRISHKFCDAIAIWGKKVSC